MIYKYICKSCDSKPFYTWFEPIVENPAFCPCCGNDEEVEFAAGLENMTEEFNNAK
ncbi:hypothetical protein [Paenibacillus sabinae]|uniref:hypothetical protein n=1 Tax=Paenibacillus sabinae TaxID=365617 RepID=UPI00130DEAA9|nr:hypothetical protein [Paenibacillus sabinae]